MERWTNNRVVFTARADRSLIHDPAIGIYHVHYANISTRFHEKNRPRFGDPLSDTVFASSTLLHHVGSNCAPVFPKVSPRGIRASCESLVRWYIGVYVSFKSTYNKKLRLVRRWTMKGTSFNFTFSRQTDYLFHYAVASYVFFTFDQKDSYSRGKFLYGRPVHFRWWKIFLEKIFWHIHLYF